MHIDLMKTLDSSLKVYLKACDKYARNEISTMLPSLRETAISNEHAMKLWDIPVKKYEIGKQSNTIAKFIRQKLHVAL